MSKYDKLRGRLWDAINQYVRACGGDPGARVFGNTPRMDAVVAIEAVADAIRDADLLARAELTHELERFARTMAASTNRAQSDLGGELLSLIDEEVPNG